VDALLTDAGLDEETIMAQTLFLELDQIDQIDRMIL
jgi:hypothetical protein